MRLLNRLENILFDWPTHKQAQDNFIELGVVLLLLVWVMVW